MKFPEEEILIIVLESTLKVHQDTKVYINMKIVTVANC